MNKKDDFKEDFKKTICKYSDQCHGCQLWDENYLDQLEHKKNDLKRKLNIHLPINVKSAGSRELRTRFDFTIIDGKMGLFNADRKFIEIEKCLQLTVETQKAFDVLKNYRFPIRKGSVRLRVSPENQWGLWLDFSNIDIKNLLLEKKLLIELSKHFFIEVGQKKKCLDPKSFQSDQIKLHDPIPKNWYRALHHPLSCYVGSFTQPGWEVSDLLVETILNWSPQNSKFIEYGSGIGQFTIPLLYQGNHGVIYETDLLALTCLQDNTKKFSDRLQINPKEIQIQDYDFALVNPPRSGLLGFCENLRNSHIEKIIYISCFPDSLQKDISILNTDYEIKEICIVDQFPQTHHYETCVLLQRINR